MTYRRSVKRFLPVGSQESRPQADGDSAIFKLVRNVVAPWTADRVSRLGDRYEGLFNRVPAGWPRRDTWVEMQAAIPSCARGDVRFRLVRLPLAACKLAASIPHSHTRAESADHRQLKHAARAWMQWDGASDAVYESTRFGGRSDVSSVSKNWVVECGHTRMGKLADAISEMPTGRFTLVPFQALEWENGCVRPILAIDFTWSLAASEEVGRLLSEQRLAAADRMWEKVAYRSMVR